MDRLNKEDVCRVKIIYIPPDEIITLLHEWEAHEAIYLPQLDLPKDAIVLSCYPDAARNSIALRIYSKEYDVVQAGSMPEVIELNYIVCKIKEK
jgi:hypothetical protein